MENSEDSQDSVVFHSSSESEKNYDEDVSNCSTVVNKFELCSVKDDGNLTKVIQSEQQALTASSVQSSKSIDSTLMDLDIRKDCATNTDDGNMIVKKVETCERGTVTDRYLMYKKKWKSTKRIQSSNSSSDCNGKRKYYNKKYHMNRNSNTYNNKYDLPYGFRKTWERRAYEMKQQQIKEILSRSYYYFTRFMHSLDHMKF